MTSSKIQSLSRKSRLRRIDNGTRYDVAGYLKRLARHIEQGKEGDVRDVVVGVRRVELGGKVGVSAFHFGTGTIENALYIWEAAKKEIT